MSLIPPGVAVDLASALDLINPVLILQRNIGGFIADVTVEEMHSDELEITDHPVEIGADVSDHAFKRPATVLIRAGWSNSSPEADGDPNYITDTYEQFLALQASRQPFDIITGKRAYTHMLVKRLTTKTDQATADVLLLEIECREVILVSTQTVQVPGSTVNRGGVPALPASGFNATAAQVT